MKTYTQKELDEKIENARSEERFVAYLVLSSARVVLRSQPVQYQEARRNIGEIVDKSTKYDEITKERFATYLVMIDNCVPVEDRPIANRDAYSVVIKDILTPAKVEE
jgi:hypothetical protein